MGYILTSTTTTATYATRSRDRPRLTPMLGTAPTGCCPSVTTATNMTEKDTTPQDSGCHVAGNVIRQVDQSGMIAETPGIWDSCFPTQTGRNCQCYDNTERDIYGLPPYMDSYYAAAEACCRGFPGYPECSPATPIPTNTVGPLPPFFVAVLDSLDVNFKIDFIARDT